MARPVQHAQDLALAVGARAERAVNGKAGVNAGHEGDCALASVDQGLEFHRISMAY